MTEFNFYLSDDDTERLFILKDLMLRGDLTGNEFARELLEQELERLYSTVPVEEGLRGLFSIRPEPAEDFPPHGLSAPEFRQALYEAIEIEKREDEQ